MRADPAGENSDIEIARTINFRYKAASNLRLRVHVEGCAFSTMQVHSFIPCRGDPDRQPKIFPLARKRHVIGLF